MGAALGPAMGQGFALALAHFLQLDHNLRLAAGLADYVGLGAGAGPGVSLGAALYLPWASTVCRCWRCCKSAKPGRFGEEPMGKFAKIAATAVAAWPCCGVLAQGAPAAHRGKLCPWVPARCAQSNSPLPCRSVPTWCLGGTLTDVKTKVEKNRILPVFPANAGPEPKSQRVQGFMMPLEPGENQSIS